MPCPHCKHKTIIRTSRELTSTLREVTYMCSNALCGHTYIALLEIIRTLSPSAMPDPSISIPQSLYARHVRVKALSENPGT